MKIFLSILILLISYTHFVYAKDNLTRKNVEKNLTKKKEQKSQPVKIHKNKLEQKIIGKPANTTFEGC